MKTQAQPSSTVHHQNPMDEAGPDDEQYYSEHETLSVTTAYKVSGEQIDGEEVDDVIQVRTFLVPPAKVGVRLGRTINMGNYESLQVSVSVEIPCYVEETGAAYEHAVQFCQERLVEVAAQAARPAAPAKKTNHPF